MVMRLSRNLFRAEVHGGTFLVAVEWYTEQKAWSYSVVGDIETLKL